MKLLNIFRCPICQKSFHETEKSLICENNHCFDFSKERYVNLLNIIKKKSKNPGDDKVMVEARQHFLNKGFFYELANQILILSRKYNSSDSIIVDAGCGPAYYLKFLSKEFKNLIGFDISKDAILKASKNCLNIDFSVASIFDMPLTNNSVDCILNIFAPKPEEEFKRILKENGKIIEVIPGKKHLIELKEILYGENLLENLDDKKLNFDLVMQEEVTYEKILSGEELKELFSMTPYFYTTKKEDIEKIDSISKLSITFDFIIKIWTNNNL
ncbi:MAG: methyltransferase domain-containing protein [Clostridia bacterium]